MCNMYQSKVGKCLMVTLLYQFVVFFNRSCITYSELKQMRKNQGLKLFCFKNKSNKRKVSSNNHQQGKK